MITHTHNHKHTAHRHCTQAHITHAPHTRTLARYTHTHSRHAPAHTALATRPLTRGYGYSIFPCFLCLPLRSFTCRLSLSASSPATEDGDYLISLSAGFSHPAKLIRSRYLVSMQGFIEIECDGNTFSNGRLEGLPESRVNNGQ